ncbi:hypothetical protein, partial [Methylosinus sp. Sm6]|uniref:hypothetical protein n=1 Tax=Methylosinus sp. Sm6 TaxID=2866948 RepID=UPI00351D9291
MSNTRVEHIEASVDLDVDAYPLNDIKVILEPVHTTVSTLDWYGKIYTLTNYNYVESQASVLLDGEQSVPSASSYVTTPDGHRHLQFVYGSVKYRGEDPGSDLWVLRIIRKSTGQEVTPSNNWSIRFFGASASDPQQWIFTDEYAGGKTISPSTVNDSFNAAAATGNNIIDLRAGATASINGKTVTVGGDLANGFGGDGRDTLTGNAGSNLLKGGRGNDTLTGNEGDDVLAGGAGADTLVGGAGVDTADYSDKAASVIVTLNGPTNAVVTVDGVAEDTIRNVENVTGGSGADTLTGDDLANLLNGGGGNDTLKGDGGADILDGGAGVDTADYGDKTSSVVATLKGAANTSVTVGGVAEDTIRNFENVVGGSGADTLIGDGLSNVLRGGGAADTLDGGAGVDTADYSDKTASVVVTLNGGTNAGVTVGNVAEDTIRNIENVTGGSGADTLTGDELANVLSGGGGNDTLKGGDGADTLDGGAGVDTADYSDKAASVVVTLNGSTNAVVTVGGVAEDMIRNIENVTGGSGDDVLSGDDLANVLNGGDGNDTLKGGGGADTLDGRAGVDTADYSDKTASVVVTLNGATNATVRVGGVDEDTIRNIENVTGGSGADTLTGDELANVLNGGGGNDTLKGGGGADILDGGDGVDTADYSDKTASVTVTLNGAANASVTVGGAGEDVIRNIENVTGGSGNDILKGDDLANVLPGGDGNDILKGDGGTDTLDGGAGVDALDYRDKATSVVVTLNGATNAVVTVGGVSEDAIRNIENVLGGSGADTLVGDGLSNLFRGGGGADTLDGGAGVDTADYSDKAASVVVTLNGAMNAIVTVGGVAEDTIRNIENVYGSSDADTLVGDSLANLLSARDGDDILKGGGGADILDGGAGVDAADYGDKTASVVLTLNGSGTAVVLVDGVAEDTIRNVENVYGGSGDDVLSGDGSVNLWDGGGGNDILRGGGGGGTLNGGAGVDTLDYSNKFESVVLTLKGSAYTVALVDGVAEDTIRNIENVYSGSGDDVLS